MAKDEKRILILGSFDDSNNIGDTAIFSNLVKDFREEIPGVRFSVPLRRRNALQPYHIDSIWSRILLFDPITAASVQRADLIIATQANIFDTQLFNITFNRLFGYSYLFAIAKRLGKKIAFYNTGLGPVTTNRGNKIASYVVNQADLITLREPQSVDYIRRWNFRNPYIVAADPALNTKPVNHEVRKKILETEGIDENRVNIGINITRYIEHTFGSNEVGIPVDQFIACIAATADQIVEEMDGAIYFLVSAASDRNITERVFAAMQHRDRARVIVPMLKYSPEEFVTILSAMDVVMGSRMHALILSATAGAPVIGLEYAPKSRNFMRNIGQETRVLQLRDLSKDCLVTMIQDAYARKKEISDQIADNLVPMKASARTSAKLIADLVR